MASHFGKTNVVLHFWILNQKQLMFNCVLHKALPNMLCSDKWKKVQAFVSSDGDDHLIAMITEAICTTHDNARLLPCAWHLTDYPTLKIAVMWLNISQSGYADYFRDGCTVGCVWVEEYSLEKSMMCQKQFCYAWVQWHNKKMLTEEEQAWLKKSFHWMQLTTMALLVNFTLIS